MSTKKALHAGMKLGKQPARHDPRTLQMANYITPSKLPPIPDSYDWTKKVKKWGMMDNDNIGDCTCAAAGHLIMEWTAENGKLVTPTDKDIISAYSAITGYNPKTGKNDNGAVETDVLNYWRRKGIAGHKISLYAALEPGNHNHIKEAVYLFGGCYIGLSLPVTAQDQKVWSVPPGGAKGNGAPNSWGGHAVPVVAYDEKELTIVTWGALKKMTWGFWDTYCEESYAIISTDFADGKKKAPSGFDLKQLQSDLKLITG
ncbi:MAG: hypothetical protein JWO58_462 [Chitinophagaceae bacterium]|nr:hypothetical protein [Chitinophagaceae bacterium]